VRPIPAVRTSLRNFPEPDARPPHPRGYRRPTPSRLHRVTADALIILAAEFGGIRELERAIASGNRYVDGLSIRETQMATARSASDRGALAEVLNTIDAEGIAPVVG
jgi:hypothetical protein